MTADSDVDVAVSGKAALSPDLLMKTATALSLELHREVDLIDLHQVEGLILHRAVTTGICLKMDEALLSKFHSKALGWKEDFLPLQQRMQASRVQRFIHGS